jgi:hypothetical protein
MASSIEGASVPFAQRGQASRLPYEDTMLARQNNGIPL